MATKISKPAAKVPAAKVPAAKVPAAKTGGTSGAGGDKSNTKTATATRTATSTEALTQGNFTATVTGGAGEGDTHVYIGTTPFVEPKKMGTSKVKVVPKGKAGKAAVSSGPSHPHVSQK